MDVVLKNQEECSFRKKIFLYISSMTNPIKSKCKICRRTNEKLFLKGDRCFSQKCAMVKRPYAPGQKRKRRGSPPSEYAKQLKEKQKLRNWYHLGERQFRNYVKKVLLKQGKVKNLSDLLIQSLEFRLDNVIFRLGFAPSRAGARQLVSHGYFLINGKTIDIPSHKLRIGDTIAMKPQKKKKGILKEMTVLIKKNKVPGWLEFNVQQLEGKVVGAPTLEEVAPPVEIPIIFEFYSK